MYFIEQSSLRAEEIARFTDGELEFIVRMKRYVITITTPDGAQKDIEAFAPDLAITLQSARGRKTLVERPADERSFARRKLRALINGLLDRSYALLGNDEAAEYGALHAGAKAKDTIQRYLDEHNVPYVCSIPYRDDNEKRTRVYGVMLQKMGYKRLANNDNVTLYGRGEGIIAPTNIESFEAVYTPRIARKKIPFLPSSVQDVWANR